MPAARCSDVRLFPCASGLAQVDLLAEAVHTAGGLRGLTGPGPARRGPLAPVPAPAVPVVTGGGMPGWQITLIAVGAALVTAIAAVFLDRVLAARRSPPQLPRDALSPPWQDISQPWTLPQGPWPVLAGQATAGDKHLPVSYRPQAGRRPRTAETAALSEVALPLRRPGEPENRRGTAGSRSGQRAAYRRRPGRGLSPPRPVCRLSALPAPDGLDESPIRPWLAPDTLARPPTRGDHPGLRPRWNQPTARSFPASSSRQENQIMTAEAHTAPQHSATRRGPQWRWPDRSPTQHRHSGHTNRGPAHLPEWELS
jgi:hypothetical protein